jgi:hypothetical protein
MIGEIMSAHKMAPTVPEKALAAPQPLSFRKRNPRLFRALVAGGIIAGLTLIGGLIIFLPLSIPAMAAVGTGAFILHFGVLPSVGVYVAMSLAAITITSVIAGFKDKIGGFFGRLFSRKPSATKKPLVVEVIEEPETSSEESTHTITRSSSADTLAKLGVSESQATPPAPNVPPKLEKGVMLRVESPEEIYKAALKKYQDHKNEVLKYLDDAIACVSIKKINEATFRDAKILQSVRSSLMEARNQFLDGNLRGDYAWDMPFKDNPEFAAAYSDDIEKIHAAFDQVGLFLASKEHQLFTDFEKEEERIWGAGYTEIRDWSKSSLEKDAGDYLVDPEDVQRNKEERIRQLDGKIQAFYRRYAGMWDQLKTAYGDFAGQYDTMQAGRVTEPTTMTRKTR